MGHGWQSDPIFSLFRPGRLPLVCISSARPGTSGVLSISWSLNFVLSRSASWLALSWTRGHPPSQPACHSGSLSAPTSRLLWGRLRRLSLVRGRTSWAKLLIFSSLLTFWQFVWTSLIFRGEVSHNWFSSQKFFYHLKASFLSSSVFLRSLPEKPYFLMIVSSFFCFCFFNFIVPHSHVMESASLWRYGSLVNFFPFSSVTWIKFRSPFLYFWEYIHFLLGLY